MHIASGDLWAGAEVQLYYLARELAQFSHVELLIVLMNEGQLADELRRCGIKIKVFDESKISFIAILKKLHKTVRDFRPALIHSHRSKENVLAGLMRLLSFTPSVRTVHGANEFAKDKFSMRRYVFQFADRMTGWFLQNKIIVVSEELREKCRKRFPDRKLVVIHNGIDIQEIIRQSTSKIDFKKSDNQFNVAFIGRFVTVKRPELFIEVAVDVLKNTQKANIHFYMLGDGPLFDLARQQIAASKVCDKIHTIGFVNNVAPYLKHMDLLVFTSEHEGLPMTLLEAMALNVAVLSHNLPTIKHVLCDGDCGYIQASDGVSEYSDMIQFIVNHPDDLDKKRHLAHDSLHAKFSIQQIAKSYLELYESIL